MDSLSLMGGENSVEAALDLSGQISQGKQRNDGYWTNLKGIPLPVSASDLERHTYCPVSWQLSKAGVSGEGEAIEKGMIAHDQIHNKMQEFKRSEEKASRELLIGLGGLQFYAHYRQIPLPSSSSVKARFLRNSFRIWGVISSCWLSFGWCWQSCSSPCLGAAGWGGLLDWLNLQSSIKVG